MAAPSPFAMIHTLDQWRRVAHDNTALAQDGALHGVVQLNWRDDEPEVEPVAGEGSDEPVLPAGMVFDVWCRLYRAVPERGQVDKLLWAQATDSYQPEATGLFAPASSSAFGDFSATGASTTASRDGPLQQPTALAVDNHGRLYIAAYGERAVLVFDLTDNRFLRRIDFAARPLALAGDGEQVFVVFADNATHYARISTHADPVLLAYPAGVIAPSAIAVTARGPYVVDQGGTADARIVPLVDASDAFGVARASALLFVAPDVLVVARGAGEDLLRFQLQAQAHSELPPLKARHYDGRGLVLTPDGHVAYWSGNDLLRATLVRLRYETRGRVVSYQLDAGDYQTQWGRLFVDACVPRGTQITARCIVSDELPETSENLPRTPPANAIGLTIKRPDLSPPMPPLVLLQQAGAGQTLHRREHGNELPWQHCVDDEHFQTYEAPVIAPAGRYLWVVLELTGTTRATPRIRSLRAEYPAHNLLRRLPQVYSRDEPAADFLRRYLAISEGNLRDIDLRATLRHVLLDPQATPAALLPWLGGFVGLAVDTRWPERARRELLASAAWLFRYRGTVMGLKRFLDIYLGLDTQPAGASHDPAAGCNAGCHCEDAVERGVIIIEHFKLRGLGGALLGNSDALTSNSVLGAGFRIGGQLGVEASTSINDIDIDSAIRNAAHRFTVIVPAALTVEQHDVIEHILKVHRPAHTVYDLCSVDAGMRAGLGLHLGLSSIVGNTSGFGRFQIGGSILGRSDTLGVAAPGTVVGASRLGGDARVG